MTTAVATKEIQQVEGEIQEFVSSVPKAIVTSEDFTQGSQQVVLITAEIKKRKKWFQDFLNPVKVAKDAAVKALKDQEALRDRTLAPLQQADTQLRQALTKWKREDDERIRKEQEKQNQLYQQRVARAEAKGKEVSEVKAPVVVAPKSSSTKVVGGSFGVTKRKVLVIVDESKIPESYYDRIRNDKRIEAALRAGLDVPGAVLKEEYGSAVRSA